VNQEQLLFEQYIRQLPGWNGIDNILRYLDREHYPWPQHFIDTSLERAKKAKIRQMIKQVRETDGRQTFASVVQTTPDGELQRVYKQECLFNLNDYYQVVKYNAGRAFYFMRLAEDFRSRTLKHHPQADAEQLHFPWEP
jgi:hypothetical protein